VKRLFASLVSGLNRLHRARSPEAARPAKQLKVEQLEGREVPTIFGLNPFPPPAVTYHGGPVIPHVQEINVFYGQDWSKAANQSTIQGLDQFMRTLTGSSYLSMLGEYGIGQGSFLGHDTHAAWGPAANATVTEQAIQNMLASEISAGSLATPTASTVYTVFLPPSVHSQLDTALSSMAHHGSFQMPIVTAVWVGGRFRFQITGYREVYYIVVPNPQGNIADNGYNLTSLKTDFQKQTEIVSHELSETVTDPLAWRDATGWHATGWYANDAAKDEIGDLVNQQVAWLDGYAVQREWSNYWGRGISPLADTSGGYVNAGGYTINVTYQGRHGLEAVGSRIYPPQMNWRLDDGSYAGWYLVG
jgi:hypothetical protein